MEFNEYNESVKNWTNGILDNYRKDAELTIRYCHELIDYGEKTADSKILGFGYYHPVSYTHLASCYAAGYPGAKGQTHIATGADTQGIAR